jgi:hypothetical protein
VESDYPLLNRSDCIAGGLHEAIEADSPARHMAESPVASSVQAPSHSCSIVAPSEASPVHIPNFLEAPGARAPVPVIVESMPLRAPKLRWTATKAQHIAPTLDSMAPTASQTCPLGSMDDAEEKGETSAKHLAS